MTPTIKQLRAIAAPPRGYEGRLRQQGIDPVPPNWELLHPLLADLLARYGFGDDELCRWLAHCCWESGYMYLLDEPHDDRWLTDHYWGDQKIRWRLGNTEELHAVLYRGRGWIHLTGQLNYLLFDRWLRRQSWLPSLGLDVIDEPSLVSENPMVGILAGIFFWQHYRVMDEFSFEKQTRIINGGGGGLRERKALYGRALHVMRL